MQPSLPLGFDNYALRSCGWKAAQFIDYAASLKLDALLFSDFDVYESLDDNHLRDLKRRADDAGVALYSGQLSICPSSKIFDPRRGTAEEQLRLGIRIAKALGSPVVRCVLGNQTDRFQAGGIQPRIDETVQVLRNIRDEAVNAGVKIAVENHAGDLQANELIGLIRRAGSDFVGATMDAGNAVWALEVPADNLERLGPYALCTGIRDSAVWETDDGAMYEWTAMGDGEVDWKTYFARYAELCPRTPVFLETISARQFPLPYRKNRAWRDSWDTSDPTYHHFLKLAEGGRPRPAPSRDPGDPQFQIAELEKSLTYCRDVLGLGAKR